VNAVLTVLSGNRAVRPALNGSHLQIETIEQMTWYPAPLCDASAGPTFLGGKDVTFYGREQ